MKTREEREREFMTGLTELTRRTGIVIGGCGCCGSPALDETKQLDPQAGYGYGYAGEVSWVSPDDDYAWKNFGKTIVRKP